MYRPVADESADKLYELTTILRSDGILPMHSTLKPAEEMRVTYVERSKLTKNLKNYAAGFNAREAISRIHDGCEEGDLNETIEVSLGRVSLFDSRAESLVVRLDHSQEIADEFKVVCDSLASLNLPGIYRQNFKPHITLARIPGMTLEDKKHIGREVQNVIPDSVLLSPLLSLPSIRNFRP
jgi:hypothetical protein